MTHLVYLKLIFLKPWSLVYLAKQKLEEEAGKRQPGGYHTGETPPPGTHGD